MMAIVTNLSTDTQVGELVITATGFELVTEDAQLKQLLGEGDSFPIPIMTGGGSDGSYYTVEHLAKPGDLTYPAALEEFLGLFEYHVELV
jgi:hypothetical protein